MFSIIVAKGKNNEIGLENQLLWTSEEDMNHFKKVTTGKTIIMGRKTYESIGRLLPNRFNVVVSSTLSNDNIQNLSIFRSLDDVYEHYKKYAGEIIIIGGSTIYEYFKDKCEKLYITEIDYTFSDADTFFPNIDLTEYNILKETYYQNVPSFKITEYIKKTL